MKEPIVSIKYPIEKYRNAKIKNSDYPNSVHFDTPEECIAIMKNRKISRIKWITFFEIHLGDRIKRYDPDYVFKEKELLSNLKDWEEPYSKWFPKWTVEELFQKIDSIPAFTKKQIEEKYKADDPYTEKKLEVALSYIKK